MELQSLHPLTDILPRFIFAIFSTIASFLLTTLSHLRMFKLPPQHSNHTSFADAGNHVAILDGSSMSIVCVPVNVVTAFIKNKVAIVLYSDWVHGRYGGVHTAVCMVCLECIDGSHAIRELVNCEHVFHRECLDTWIDVGRVTCPLCRSMLLPPKKLLSTLIATVGTDG